MLQNCGSQLNPQVKISISLPPSIGDPPMAHAFEWELFNGPEGQTTEFYSIYFIVTKHKSLGWQLTL